MTDESREELISAYLDGELTADERVRVETWLAESAELRQLHDELRGLQGSMRSLERHKLDHDLSSAVLRRAEQDVLRGAESTPVAGSIAPTRAAPSWWNRGGGWRRVAWPAAAIAAALLIMVFNAREAGVEREVARAPEQRKSASELKDSMPVGDLATPALEAGPKSGEADKSELPIQSRFRSEDGANAGRMSRAAAKPAAAAPPAEPAVGGAATNGVLDRNERLEVLVGKADRGRGFVFDVSPEYLHAKSFEKLLDEKKIKWERVDAKKSRDDAPPSDAEKLLGDEAFAVSKAPSAHYAVELPEDRLEEILGQLGKKARQLSRANDELDRDTAAKRKALSADATRRVYFLLVAPARPAPPAAPPAPADKP